MKKIFILLVASVSFQASAQKAEIIEEGGKFGLKTDFGKELLPADYVKITRCKTDSLDYYIADLEGSSEIYSYNTQKRDVFDEAQGQNFTVIQWEWDKPSKSNQFYGITALGEKYQLQGQQWMKLKFKGMIGCKDKSGKYAVCQGGKALSGYDYKGIDAKHRNLVVAETDTGWIALDAKIKSHYDWSFDEIHDSDVHPEAFIVRKDKRWGILSLDGSMNVPPSIMKNPDGMFDFDGPSFAELNRSYAVQRGGKWGVINQKNETNVECRYDNAYMIDDFAIEQHGLSVHAVVQDGGTWRFLNEKWEEHKTAQFEKWVGVHGEVAFVIKEGKVWQLDLKTFDTQANLYFGEYDEYQIVKSEDGKTGVVSKQGEMLMPFDFDWVVEEGEDDNPFLVAAKGGKDGIYDLNGKNLVPHNYEGLMYLETKNKVKYFSVGAEGEAALASWSEDSGKMVILSERIYQQVSFQHSDGTFTAETEDGEFHLLNDQGKLTKE